MGVPKTLVFDTPEVTSFQRGSRRRFPPGRLLLPGGPDRSGGTHLRSRIERFHTAGSEVSVTTTKRPNSPCKLLHVTNLLSKEGIFVPIRWTYCNKIINLQCCQYHTLIRVLPEEPTTYEPLPVDFLIIVGTFVGTDASERRASVVNGEQSRSQTRLPSMRSRATPHSEAPNIRRRLRVGLEAGAPPG